MIIDGSESSLKKFLSDLPPVDQVGADSRAAMLATRSIKTTSKAWAIDLAISMVDLTTLEGADSAGKVKALCAKAVRPDPTDSSVPSVGAICVYNDMVKIARTELDLIGGKDIAVAAVATAFPSGRASIAVKKLDTQDAIDAGANEICSQSYLVGNYFENIYNAERFFKYLHTQFVRILILPTLTSQDLSKEKFQFVPLQDFTENSDIDWSKSIPEIDKQLYAKYDLTEVEIGFIEKMIKPMN